MLLINPATTKFGGFLSRFVPVGIPVAIGAIAAYLEQSGIKCKVLDELRAVLGTLGRRRS